MSLRALLSRSRDALTAMAGVSTQDVLSGDADFVSERVWSEGNGLGGLLGLGPTSTGSTDWKNLFFWMAVFTLMVFIAVITKPNETSFRSHLTELSFRSTLADIRRSENDDAVLPDEHAHLPSSNAPSIPGSGADTPNLALPHTQPPSQTIAPFRFANRVAISLRTPTLLYRSFFVCAIAITSPLAPPTFLADAAHLGKVKHASQQVRERHVVWFGCLGRWSEVGLVPASVEWVWRVLTRGEREKGRKKAALDKAGVLDLRAVQPKEEPLSTPNGKASLGHSASKNLRKSDSVVSIPDALPLHSLPAPLPTGPVSPESRRPSLVNLMAPPPAATTVDPETVSSPILTALKAELATAQTVVTDLQAQLTSHEESVHDAHAHLQVTLDDLRTRRKEDDAERQELKSRTKSCEEQKRQAEGARREAEKKLRAVEAVRDGLAAKISAAESEIRDLRVNMETSEKSVRVLREEGERYVVEIREEVERRKRELQEVKDEIAEVEGKNEGLAQRVKEAEERLKEVIDAGEAAKKIGPEDEMIMMAAAYEAAAQEGYHNGYQHAHGGNSQWATQAAAYMAEAGMPQLGYDYTARPTTHAAATAAGGGAAAAATGFGHLANRANSGSTRDLGELRRFGADMVGFEDFGPGAVGSASNSRRPSQAVGLPGGPAAAPAPASDSESEIYGHDPGSPNGGISSSFSANLLGQNLFSSLEGDQTPYVGAGDDFSVVDDPLRLDLGEGDSAQGDDSASDSGDDADEVWRSPMPEPRMPNQAQPSHPHPHHGYLQHHRLPSGSMSASRLPLPSSTSPSLSPGPNGNSTTPPLLPGLPALPGSRRWFSGTLSSDNIPSTNGSLSHTQPFGGGAFSGFMHPTTSNDSLNLGPGYENSPFAPTAGEKKALAAAKWKPFTKRWAGAEADGGASGSTGTSIGGGWPSSLGFGMGRRENSGMGVASGSGSGAGAVGEQPYGQQGSHALAGSPSNGHGADEEDVQSDRRSLNRFFGGLRKSTSQSQNLAS
ncbi:hypothetical protein IAT38_006644 [Cryptococcus sp. DSM 104549]